MIENLAAKLCLLLSENANTGDYVTYNCDFIKNNAFRKY